MKVKRFACWHLKVKFKLDQDSCSMAWSDSKIGRTIKGKVWSSEGKVHGSSTKKLTIYETINLGAFDSLLGT